MARLKVPTISASRRSGMMLQEAEIMFDIDDKYFYGGDGSTIGGKAIGSGFSFNTEVVEVTAEVLSSKSFQLLKSPNGLVILTPQGGPPQIQNIDFEVSLSGLVSWNGLGLDGFVDLGDLFIVQY